MIFASTLPEDSHYGYVAAAYIVFFALVLVYVVIMAIRLTRVERAVRTLKGAPHGGGQAGELRSDAGQENGGGEENGGGDKDWRGDSRARARGP